jgi:hypothetical protein
VGALKWGALRSRLSEVRTPPFRPRLNPRDLGTTRLVTGVVKSLWASVQGDPVFMRRVNGWLTVFWLAMIPVSIETHWISSVTYVAALSLWALVSGHWSAWQAARVEVNQERESKERDAADVPGEIVDRMVEETDVQQPS